MKVEVVATPKADERAQQAIQAAHHIAVHLGSLELTVGFAALTIAAGLWLLASAIEGKRK